MTGVLLAIARAAGETAPLLFTAGATMKTSFNLGGFMNSLPVQIYNDVTSPTPSVEQRAWGAALTLVVLILLLNVVARSCRPPEPTWHDTRQISRTRRAR